MWQFKNALPRLPKLYCLQIDKRKVNLNSLDRAKSINSPNKKASESHMVRHYPTTQLKTNSSGLVHYSATDPRTERALITMEDQVSGQDK